MARRSLDTAFARAILSLGRADSRSPLWREDRQQAEASAERLKKWLRLTGAEAAVFDRVVFDRVLFGAAPGAALREALDEVDDFRAACRRLGDPPEMEIAFLDERAWEAEWRREHRVLVLFEPAQPASPSFRLGPPEDFKSRPQKLVLTDGTGDGLPPSAQAQRLRRVSFSRRDQPFQWKGSRIRIFEGKTPEDSGRGPVETQTSVYAEGELAAPAFDFITEELKHHHAALGEGEALWLGIALPYEGTSMPRSREVGPFGTVADPVSIDRPAPRLCLQLFRAAVPTSRNDELGAEPLCQWMAVETTPTRESSGSLLRPDRPHGKRPR